MGKPHVTEQCCGIVARSSGHDQLAVDDGVQAPLTLLVHLPGVDVLVLLDSELAVVRGHFELGMGPVTVPAQWAKAHDVARTHHLFHVLLGTLRAQRTEPHVVVLALLQLGLGVHV